MAEQVIGCGALRELGGGHGEIKSMHTVQNIRRLGVGSLMLRHIIAEAEGRGYDRLSLETGSQPAFEAARRFYERHGFAECPPFGQYRNDRNSVFMTLKLIR